MKSLDLVGNETTDEYKELLNLRKYLETQKEKLELEIERCKQDMVDAETIKKTLLAFDKIISALPIEDQKELLQLLIKEIRVFSFDPGKEKAPRENGAFVTKIRTKWYKIRLNLYQIPEIDTFYKGLVKRKESSDSQGNWLLG